jgi:hypothetical protein
LHLLLATLGHGEATFVELLVEPEALMTFIDAHGGRQHASDQGLTVKACFARGSQRASARQHLAEGPVPFCLDIVGRNRYAEREG